MISQAILIFSSMTGGQVKGVFICSIYSWQPNYVSIDITSWRIIAGIFNLAEFRRANTQLVRQRLSIDFDHFSVINLHHRASYVAELWLI